MPEPTTRDEHVARAQELAEAAYAYHVDLKNAAKILQQDPEQMIGAQRVAELNQMAAASVARMHALAAMATAHAQIAEVLGQQPAVAPGPLWVPVSKHRYERDGGVWALEYRSRLVDDDPDVGWWLYGPTCTTGARMGHGGLALAQQRADYRIDEMVGRAGPHPQLDWRVKTSARDLFS